MTYDIVKRCYHFILKSEVSCCVSDAHSYSMGNSAANDPGLLQVLLSFIWEQMFREAFRILFPRITDEACIITVRHVTASSKALL